MSVPVASGLTYDDLWELPQDDGLRREDVDVYRLDEHGRYGAPATLDADGTLTCQAAPGLQLPVADVLHA